MRSCICTAFNALGIFSAVSSDRFASWSTSWRDRETRPRVLRRSWRSCSGPADCTSLAMAVREPPEVLSQNTRSSPSSMLQRISYPRPSVRFLLHSTPSLPDQATGTRVVSRRGGRLCLAVGMALRSNAPLTDPRTAATTCFTGASSSANMCSVQATPCGSGHSNTVSPLTTCNAATTLPLSMTSTGAIVGLDGGGSGAGLVSNCLAGLSLRLGLCFGFGSSLVLCRHTSCP
mmetsp:Transcript_40448/g.106189  ORF Transcript_40448/g.106189 Transcript_40448/m.106189 type:complete len:232 (-) Transcript_40448:154-849(-)